MNQHDTPAKVASTDGLGLVPERGLLARLQSLKLLLGTDSPEVRGWAPVVQQGAQATVNAAIAALKRVDAAVAAERERCARVCDDETRIRSEAAATHPEFSDERARCNAAARAAINCAKGCRNGEEV